MRSPPTLPPRQNLKRAPRLKFAIETLKTWEFGSVCQLMIPQLEIFSPILKQKSLYKQKISIYFMQKC